MSGPAAVPPVRTHLRLLDPRVVVWVVVGTACTYGVFALGLRRLLRPGQDDIAVFMAIAVVTVGMSITATLALSSMRAAGAVLTTLGARDAPLLVALALLSGACGGVFPLLEDGVITRGCGLGLAVLAFSASVDLVRRRR